MSAIDLAGLRAEAEATDPAYPCDVAREHLLALLKEIERLREALSQIAEIESFPTFNTAQLANAKRLARATLAAQ